MLGTVLDLKGQKGNSETHPDHKDPQSNKGAEPWTGRTAEQGRKRDMPQGDCGPLITPNLWTLCDNTPGPSGAAQM